MGGRVLSIIQQVNIDSCERSSKTLPVDTSMCNDIYSRHFRNYSSSVLLCTPGRRGFTFSRHEPFPDSFSVPFAGLFLGPWCGLPLKYLYTTMRIAVWRGESWRVIYVYSAISDRRSCLPPIRRDYIPPSSVTRYSMVSHINHAFIRPLLLTVNRQDLTPL